GFHIAVGGFDGNLDGADQTADIPGGLGRPLGQLPHLVRHDAETAAVLAGARRFNRRVESQQVGLVRDVADEADDLPDLTARVPQLVHALRDPLHGRADLGHAVHHATHRVVAGLGPLGPTAP